MPGALQPDHRLAVHAFDPTPWRLHAFTLLLVLIVVAPWPAYRHVAGCAVIGYWLGTLLLAMGRETGGDLGAMLRGVMLAWGLFAPLALLSRWWRA
jgi:hypothetical protein